MTHGLDTGFLVAAELAEHSEHAAARATLAQLVAAGDLIAIAPQVIAEFIHVATDSRRLAQPLDVKTAAEVAQRWWLAKEVVHIFPSDTSTQQFFDWIHQFALGRKRLLDTILAATFQQAGIQSVLTTNARDFGVFGSFTCILPGNSVP